MCFCCFGGVFASCPSCTASVTDCAMFRDVLSRLSDCGAFRTQLVPKLAPRLQPQRNSAREARAKLCSGWSLGANVGTNCVRNAPQYESLDYAQTIINMLMWRPRKSHGLQEAQFCRRNTLRRSPGVGEKKIARPRKLLGFPTAVHSERS